MAQVIAVIEEAQSAAVTALEPIVGRDRRLHADHPNKAIPELFADAPDVVWAWGIPSAAGDPPYLIVVRKMGRVRGWGGRDVPPGCGRR